MLLLFFLVQGEYLADLLVDVERLKAEELILWQFDVVSVLVEWLFELGQVPGDRDPDLRPQHI